MLRREASVAASEFAADADFKQIAMKSSLVPEALFGPQALDAVPATRQRLHMAVMEKAATSSDRRASTGDSSFSFPDHNGKQTNSNPNKATKARRLRQQKLQEARSDGHYSGTTGPTADSGATTASD
jgi:hypothetical protein